VVDDLSVLRLLGSLVPQYCPQISEEKVKDKAFDILFAFDEVVSQGYSESISIDQVMQNLEMESVEEEVAKLQKKKQQEEAVAVAREKAKALSKAKKELGLGNSSMGGGNDMQEMVRSSDQISSRPITSQVVHEEEPKSATVSKGAMMLGKAKRMDVASKVLGESGIAAPQVVPQQQGASQGANVIPATTEPVDVRVEEKISVVLKRDGGHNNLEVKGNLFMVITDPKYGDVKVMLGAMNQDFAFKTHAFINKALFASDNILALKDAGKTYPSCQSVEVLRWRLQKPESLTPPLMINCWPSDSSVNVEYELENKNMVLRDVRICIPLGGAFPTTASLDCGEYEVNSANGSLIWKIPVITGANAEGNMEVSLNQKVSPNAFFPTSVQFTSPMSLAGVKVHDVRTSDSGASAAYALVSALTAESYTLE